MDRSGLQREELGEWAPEVRDDRATDPIQETLSGFAPKLRERRTARAIDGRDRQVVAELSRVLGSPARLARTILSRR